MVLSLLNTVPRSRSFRSQSARWGRLQLRSSILEPRATGDGVEKRLLQAAEGGDARSQYNLGILYDNGLDDNGYAVAGNRPQAVKWLLAAAEQGLPRAQVKLAEVYAAAPDISGSHAIAGGWPAGCRAPFRLRDMASGIPFGRRAEMIGARNRPESRRDLRIYRLPPKSD